MRLVALLLGGGLVVACAALPGVAPPSLEGTTWQVVQIGGQPPVHGSEPNIAFEGGRVAGSMGCNGFTGLFRIEGTTIAVAELATSDAACLEPLATQERLFLEALAGARGVRMDGERLVLGGPGGELVFQPFPFGSGPKGERPFGILT